MWRVWGIVVLLLRQDLGSPFTSPEHEAAIRPPTGWLRRIGSGPFVGRFTPPELDETSADGERKIPPWGITISHLFYRSNPTPLEGFVKQAKSHIDREFKGARITDEKQLTIGGRRAYRLIFEYENSVQIKTMVPRTNLECYLVDASFLKSDESKYRALAEASLATFEIVPRTLSDDESAADGRMLDRLKTGKIHPALLGERWHTIYLVGQKTGAYRTLLTQQGKKYSFEADVRNDFGGGNLDTTVARGSFTADGRSQSIEIEQSKANDKKERWQFRVSASIEGGVLKASRDMNGVKEERTVRVEEGVLFDDVADVMRRGLVFAGTGTYLLKTVSPYADEWTPEMVEVNDRESLDLDGVKHEAFVVFSRPDRRKTMTYYVGPDGALVRQGGVKDAFSIRISTKEEALGAGGK